MAARQSCDGGGGLYSTFGKLLPGATQSHSVK